MSFVVFCRAHLRGFAEGTVKFVAICSHLPILRFSFGASLDQYIPYCNLRMIDVDKWLFDSD